MKEIPDHGDEYDGARSLSSALNGAELPPRPKHGVPAVVCPNCGEPDNYRNAVVLRGSFNPLAFLAGGLIAVILHNASHKRRVQCNNCGACFSVPTTGPTLSLLLLVLLVGLPFVIFLVSFLIKTFW
jgi:hypothetical protein